MDEECPVCERASELIYRVEDFDKSLETLEGETNIKIKDTNIRVDKVDERINKLLVSSLVLFATALISLSIAVYANLT